MLTPAPTTTTRRFFHQSLWPRCCKVSPVCRNICFRLSVPCSLRAWQYTLVLPWRTRSPNLLAAALSPIRDTLHRRLQPFRCLHSCSGCFRLEQLPGGTFTHWKTPPYHGAHPSRSFRPGIDSAWIISHKVPEPMFEQSASLPLEQSTQRPFLVISERWQLGTKTKRTPKTGGVSMQVAVRSCESMCWFWKLQRL